MEYFNKHIDDIAEEDLQLLVDDQVSERKTIEYKSNLPGNSDSEKKEFFADVSSFANSIGGILVYGIKESNGIPTALEGIKDINGDDEKLAIENSIRSGIAPRIHGIETAAISLNSGNSIILISIPSSWQQPHMVTYKGSSKFFTRSSNGKYPMDVSEIHSSFVLSETATVQIRDFRAERLSNIVSGQTPVKMSNKPKIVLHMLPLTSFKPGQRYELSEIKKLQSSIKPIYSAAAEYRVNFDGYLSYTPIQDGISYTYVQVFHSGIIEAVDSEMLESEDEIPNIPSITFEKEIVEAVERLLGFQKELGIPTPIVLMLSLLDVRGYTIATQSGPLRPTQ